MHKDKRFPTLSLEVVCLPACEKNVAKVFFNILNDYCYRFSAKIKEEPFKINIACVEYPEESTDMGVTIHSLDIGNRILVQVRDPFLSEWECNYYTKQLFLDVLCHEFVHVCQTLTGRDGFKIPKLKYDKDAPDETYFFDPCEVEARVLEHPYTALYAEKLL